MTNKSSYLILVMVLMVVSASCMSSYQAKELFVREREFDKGKLITQIAAPLIEVIPVNEQTSLYIYEFKKTGCRWSCTVDVRTQRILSWQFVSDPDLCRMKINYLGPW
jgi:hypothetical protein